jgi:NAD(P)-dependent dehydrogenase (short-subunit alcohol dehydrogenase family)
LTLLDQPPQAVVITGASTGIGAACALDLDRRGLHVFAGVRKPDDASQLQAQASPRLTPIFIDVTAPETIRAAQETVQSAGLPLRGLINNAGIAVIGPLECVPIEALRRQMEVNVIGQMAVTQAFLPLLRLTKGRVIFIGSIGGRSSLPLFGAYCASKFAQEGLVDALRVELRPWGMPVIMLEPGGIQTPIWGKMRQDVAALPTTLPPQAEDLYGPALAHVRRIGQTFKGRPVESVTRILYRALTAPRPQNRYVIGRDARQRLLLEALPDWLRDWLVARVFKLS